MFCDYKNMLGIPRQGVHQYRLGGLAIVDVVLTFLLALVVSRWIRQSFWWVLLVLFVLGIGLHRLFCVRTQLDTLLFSE
jgi:hypothetical protein